MRKIRKATNTLTALAIGASVFMGCTRNENGLDHINANTADINFARAAAMSNFTEVTLGKLDTLKGVDSAVKVFGNMMITDHTTSDSLLKSIANPLGLSTPDSLDANHQALRTQLTGLTGRAFDSVYIHSQVADHQAAVDLFTAETTNGQQYQLKLYATNMLPTLQQHLAKATELAANF
jgi:putative membrane protein